MDTIEKDITEILYNLRRIRRKKHLSQKDVAEKMGTTQQVVSKIENWGFIQLLISFLIVRFIQFKSNIDRLKNLGFNIPIEKSLKEEKKSRDKTVRMIWIITIFCYLMLVLKVGFNYWIYSIGLTILVIDIFLLVMSRVEDNDDNDTENKER